MEDANGLPLWVTLLLGLGGGGVLLSLLQSIFKWVTGRGDAERTRNRTLSLDIRGAEADADAERELRITYQEYAAHLRLIALEHGIDPDTLPAPPRRHSIKEEP